MRELIIQYPLWYILLCLLFGAGLAALLYFRDGTFQGLKTWPARVMAFCRFLAGSLLAFLLLSPLIRARISEVQKPIITIAIDASQSIKQAASKSQLELLKTKVNALEDALKEKFQVQIIKSTNPVTAGYPDSFQVRNTNLSAMIEDVQDRVDSKQLGSMILISDGIYNEGQNPLYTIEKMGIPVYTVGLGDTTNRKDISIKRVISNKIVYLGDKFTVEVDLAANRFTGTKINLNCSVRNDGGGEKLIKSEQILIDKDNFFKTVPIQVEATTPGILHIHCSVPSITGESTTLNNSRELFIEVLDARQKVLILADSPHPDCNAIQQALSSNKNYVVDIKYASDFKGSISEYQVIICHQLPSRDQPATVLLKQIKDQNKNVIFIAGGQSLLSELNNVQSLCQIQGGSQSLNDAQPSVQKNFSLFTLPDVTWQAISVYPPLQAPFGDYKVLPGANVCLLQRIGKVDTKFPLMLFGESQGRRVGLICGEGLWRWRLFDYLQRQNHENFDALLTASIQYISSKEDNRRFRVIQDRNVILENEPVKLDAELYNESYQLINEPEVLISMKNQERKEYKFHFNRTDSRYTLDAGYLPSGNYQYEAGTDFNGKHLSFSGKFLIQPMQLELTENKADHNLLKSISQQSGGKFHTLDNMQLIPEEINSSNKLKPILYTSERTMPLMHFKIFFFIALTLLAIEWFLRRWMGRY